MNLLIPDSWLKKFLNTNAKPLEIAKFLSLSGPSVERIEKAGDGDIIYHIEITTNRVDCAGVFGIAREAAAILPRFGVKATLNNQDFQTKKFKFSPKADYLEASVDQSLCPRFTCVLVRNVTIKDSPYEIKKLLEKSGVRPINNIVDVSNLVMHELGQPVHTFDYDKITNHKMILRNSKKGEHITTLDGKSFKLSGGDIVIEDGKGRLIDLCGIMGGENSAIDEKTKNVLLFVQTYDPQKIRRTSMSLAQRSEAAILFEKDLDPEAVVPAILRSIELIEDLSGGKAEKVILDIYPNSYKEKIISTDLWALEKIIGIKLEKNLIKKYLESLGFKVKWISNNLYVSVPSFRSKDIDIPEDIAEEVARIYGYHNLPSVLMDGKLPPVKSDSIFRFEGKVKQVLKGLGGIEIYSLSLVEKSMIEGPALKLQNPLGKEGEYLRTSLKFSLLSCVAANPAEKGIIHFFELANVYIPHKNNLPEEKLMLGGIIKNGDYREDKGIVEALLEEIGTDYQFMIYDHPDFYPNQHLTIKSGGSLIGEIGNLEKGGFYYEFDMDKLLKAKKRINRYQDPLKFPPQIESLTLSFPPKTKMGEVVDEIKKSDKKISKAELTDIYEDSWTFEVRYQDKEKTMDNAEVEKLRNKIIQTLKVKFGASFKE